MAEDRKETITEAMEETMTQKIILSADSTCDLDQELKERYDVHYFPLHIILDGKDYKDGIDITPEEIYQEYYDRKILPKTAAVNVAEYIEHFQKWVEDGYEVIHINLGSGLSSAHQNCKLAAEELGHIHVIDSCSLSTGTGLLVKDAGEMIRQGMDAESIAEELEKRVEKCHAIFITHSGIAQEAIDLVKQTIEGTMHFDEIHVTKASCTISSHCGPNTLGILFESE